MDFRRRKTIERLLKKIGYDNQKDKIILTGDLVNRGPKSLDVLNYCMADKNITTVLGNHDLYLLYLMSIKQRTGKLKKIVEAENNKEIFDWLITRPLLIQKSIKSTKNKFIIIFKSIASSMKSRKSNKNNECSICSLPKASKSYENHWILNNVAHRSFKKQWKPTLS